MGGMINTYNTLIGKSESKRKFGRSNSRWEKFKCTYPNKIMWGGLERKNSLRIGTSRKLL
jgi:hypothetical protein